jgi:hypothetical protein
MPPKKGAVVKPKRQARKRKRKSSMSEAQWQEHQRQVWRERQQKYRARKEAEEDADANEESEEETDVVAAKLVEPSDDSYIHSIDTELMKQLVSWHNRYSKEEIEAIELNGMESETKFTDHGAKLGGILKQFLETLLPGFIVSHLQARLGTMTHAAYFQPKAARQTRNSGAANAGAFDYDNVRVLIIPGIYCSCCMRFVF